MAVIKLFLAFFIISFVTATSLAGCSTTTNPTCGEVWTHCGGVICGDCPICFDKSTTTFPPAASTPTPSSTLSTVILPAASITITPGITRWPTNPPAEPTTPPSLALRGFTPAENCGFACNNHDCVHVCQGFATYAVFIPYSILKDGGLVSVNLGGVQKCLEWTCGPGGCMCGKYNGATKRSVEPQKILGADGKEQCGFACNQHSCSRICLTSEYAVAYKAYPDTIFVPESTAASSITIALASSTECAEWICKATGCQCSNRSKTSKHAAQKRGECWEVCDNNGHNCSAVCSADAKKLYHASIEKRGDCSEVCTPGSNDHHCPIVCTDSNAQPQKRQCQQTCDKDGKNCVTSCKDEPKEDCYQVCDKDGKCETQCSLIGEVEKRQCWQTCDEDGNNCKEDCETVPKENCYQVCDEQGKCETECSIIGEVEK